MLNAAIEWLCALCDGTGWKPTEDNRVERCECWLAAKQTHAPGVPYEFQSATLENYRPITGNQTAMEVARKFAASDRDLYLCGGVGAGKTRLACSILNDVYRRDGHGFFSRVPMLLMRLQPQRTDEASADAANLLHRLCTEPVIVLDDVGAERDAASDYTRRTMLTIYEERGDKHLRTIWTSNLRLARRNDSDRHTLGEFMGDDRLASRIAGRSDVVWIGTSDQRLTRRSREIAS
jgi:DNA replication protein DnaC